MVWSHYLQETTGSQAETSTEAYNSDDEKSISRTKPLDYQMWLTWFSRDLMNLWMGIKAYKEDSGNETYILDQCEYDDFCSFCYELSCKLPSKYPS